MLLRCYILASPSYMRRAFYQHSSVVRDVGTWPSARSQALAVPVTLSVCRHARPCSSDARPTRCTRPAGPAAQQASLRCGGRCSGRLAHVDAAPERHDALAALRPRLRAGEWACDLCRLLPSGARRVHHADWPCLTQRLEDALKALLAEFAAKETWERPRRLALMEFAGGDLTVVCNPNAYPTAFQAKALITFQSHGVQVTGEGGLSALRQDVEAFQRGGTA